MEMLHLFQAEKRIFESGEKLDLLHLSLEKRMAELSPESAEAGIFKENNHNFGRDKKSWLQKPAALTGKLEVSEIISPTIAFLFYEYGCLSCTCKR